MDKIKKTNQSEQILDAAYKCISSKGYANISLRNIANEAGVALSQLHYYFGSKKDLFREIIKRMIKKYLTEFEYHLEKESTSKDKITSIIKYFQKVLKNDPELFKLLYDLSSLALWSDSFKDLLSNLFKDLTEMIEECVANSNSLKDNLKEYNSDSLARIILGSALGIALQFSLDSNNNEKIINSLDLIPLIFE